MLGAHLSISGGLVNALLEAQRLKCNTVQVFTKNQRQWKARPLDEDEARAWLDELHRLGWTKTVSHASYLINLASPAPELWSKSVDAMTDEVERAERLEIPYVVVHPGSHTQTSEAAGIDRIVRALDEVTGRTRGYQTVVCLETTVGGGSQIGGTFEHLAAIRAAVRQPERVGTCLDTCHVTAAGYDLSTAAKARETFERFDAVVGLEHLRCFHLNDSKFERASRRDRHAHIGLGCVGLDGFRLIVNDPRFAGVPKIIETEKGTDEKGVAWDTINLRRLRGLMRSARETAPASSPARPRSAAATKSGAEASGRRRAFKPRAGGAAATGRRSHQGGEPT